MPPRPPTADATSPAGRRAAGRRAEDLACAHLQARGWRVVARNVFGGGGELDIVARSAEVLVFVEVRARSSDRLVAPEESVGPGKQRRLVAAARHYLAHHLAGRWPACMRFDVLAVVLGPPPRIRHIEEAFVCGQ